MVALVGSVLGRSTEGRRAIKVASFGLSALVVVYIAAAMYVSLPEADEYCIYAAKHPSDCK